MNWSLALLALFLTGVTGASANQNDRVVVPLDGVSLPDTLVRNNVDASLLKSGPNRGLDVRFHVTDWPNAAFSPVSGVWDWSGYSGIAVDIFNPESRALNVFMRVDNKGADGVKNCNTQSVSAAPGAWTTLRLRFHTVGDKSLWGMRGLPITGPTGGGAVLDTGKVVAFQIFLAQPSAEHAIILNNIRVYGAATGAKVEFPFVDRYGQYKNADWPGKLKTDVELKARGTGEAGSLSKGQPANSTLLSDRDVYGGWLSGPKQMATGWFRTARIDGRWWLVDPDGNLFFSTGIDCVTPDEYTYIDARDKWFEWLPSANEPYSQFIVWHDGAHSMAEPIGGKGRTFSFYCANLCRKYGGDWRSSWETTSAERMRSWGFNTVGNWSDPEFIAHSKVPFVATGGISGSVRRIEGGGGYWGKMVDAYDPAFEAAADASLGEIGRTYAANKYCIGYFADNEIAWEAVEKGTLASPPDQPCRVAEVQLLKAKYNSSLQQLNDAWAISAPSWDALRAPDRPNAACQADLDAFVFQFAKRYFEVCKAALKKAAPNQLYLGCRFASAPKPAVRACAAVADVVSFNIYRSGINSADWTGANDLGKPLLIGEFHFGALDRGMFHEGLGPTSNQNERAAAYQAYVRSVADCPNFVGCHWFQYVDEPITGRWFDGENYNIGLVDVTDTPYPELLAATKRTNSEVYERHSTAR